MSQPLSPVVAEPRSLLTRLRDICSKTDLKEWALRLEHLHSWMSEDLASIEADLESVARGPLAIHRCGRELLDLSGKRLRPLCVALASRMGEGFGESSRELAVAVELIHNATLLHDDVVDFGEVRRGAPTARMVYGNATAIFGGDWLLVEALKRVSRLALPGLMELTLDTIEAMIEAEARQLEERGQITADREDYFQIVDGKTAALFRLALRGGAQAGGMDLAGQDALEAYGSHLGLAFQLIDDVLDYEGDQEALGKDPFADLREGRTTFPLLLALERSPGLLGLLREGLHRGNNGDHGGNPAEIHLEIQKILETTGALKETRDRARREADRAILSLEALPSSRERSALAAVAEVSVQRRS